MKMSYEVFLELRKQVPEAQVYRVVRDIGDYPEESADLLIQEVHYIQALPRLVKAEQVRHLKYPVLASRLAFCGCFPASHFADYYDIPVGQILHADIPYLQGKKRYYFWGDVKEWARRR